MRHINDVAARLHHQSAASLFLVLFCVSYMLCSMFKVFHTLFKLYIIAFPREDFQIAKFLLFSLSVCFGSYIIITRRGCSILLEVIIPSESHPGSRLRSAVA